MHVEIDDGDAREPVMPERVMRGGSDIAQKAESHRRLAFGMVPRRARRAKGVGRLAREHEIHRPDRRARAAPRGPEAARREPRVGVDLARAQFGRVAAQIVEIGFRMHPQQVRLSGERRLDAHQVHTLKRTEHGVEPRHLLGVAGGRGMVETVGMGQERCGHESAGNPRSPPGASATMSPPREPHLSCLQLRRTQSGVSM